MRNAAAPATTTFETMTGGCPVITPYASHVNAPAACTASRRDGRTKYEPTNTAVASHPTQSDNDCSHAVARRNLPGLGRPERQQVRADLVPLLDQESTRLEEGTDLGRRVNLELVWRRAYRRVRAELATYSNQELMADLRMNRSDIDSIAAEGADEQVARFVAAHPAYRRVGHGWASLGRVAG